MVYTDETGLKVDGIQCWIWVFRTKAETLFAVRKGRGKKVLKEILGEEFKGVSLRRLEVLSKLYKANPKMLGPPIKGGEMPG